MQATAETALLTATKGRASVVSLESSGNQTVLIVGRAAEPVTRNDPIHCSNGEQIMAVPDDAGPVAATNQQAKHNEGNRAKMQLISGVFALARKPSGDKPTKKEEKIKRKKEKSAARKERKATKTLAIVLGN